jgi:CheY-like chemotaxis protein
MMNILIVEDDEHKVNSISLVLRSFFYNFNPVHAPSLYDARMAITNDNFDLILVDMAIPSHPVEIGQGSPISYLSGGIEVLLELSFLERKDPCIVITQHPTIEISGNFYNTFDSRKILKERLDCEVLDCIYYDESTNDWKNKLLMAFKKI